MAYRFVNDNLLVIYRSNVYGDFTFSVRHIDGPAEMNWEWDISVGKKITKVGIDGQEYSFPQRGVSDSRDKTLLEPKSLFLIDPDIRLVEVHDGRTRTSTYYGYIAPELGELGLPMGGVTLGAPGLALSYGVKKVEVWDDSGD